MKLSPIITRSMALGELWACRGDLCREAEVKEAQGHTVSAYISLKLVNLIDRELQARGVLPRENGGAA